MNLAFPRLRIKLSNPAQTARPTPPGEARPAGIAGLPEGETSPNRGRYLVEVLALFAKHELRDALQQIVGRAAEDEHVPTVQRPRQQQRRLAPDQIDDLVVGYINGESIDGLARAYGINRTTAIAHLERNGVERRRNPRKMTDAKVSAAAERYATGLSLATVAAEFGVCDRTLRREFVCADVSTRPRSGE